jgi:oligoribonuclease NrnB/cAMP/cGMP phosphodiesterase (DHH superfamily)
LNAQYARKASELKADYVFVLDKPLISKEFVEEIDKLQLPIVWIDHHEVFGNEIFDKSQNFHIFNPARNSGKEKSFEPVTYLAYQITKRKEDLWIALMGCISDHFMPNFVSEFVEKYSEFWKKGIEKPFEALYKTEIGKIAQALSFGLKDSISNVVAMQNFLITCNTPSDILSEVKENKAFREKYLEIKKKYQTLLDNAKKETGKKMLFFEYGGDLSISSELSNELSFTYPNKYIIVAYHKGNIINFSMRGKHINEILQKALKVCEGASGGGHEDAVGARIRSEHLVKFKNALEKEINGN